MTRSDADPASRAFASGNALALVAYQPGAVVSREILRKSTGTVTAFAFDAGQGLSEHMAKFDALVHVLDGVAEVTLGGVAHRLAKDDLLLMPANVPNALRALERFKMLLVMIRDAG